MLAAAGWRRKSAAPAHKSERTYENRILTHLRQEHQQDSWRPSLPPLGSASFFGLILIAPRLSALNHASIVGWIPDQRVVQKDPFTPRYFRIIDPDGNDKFTFTTQCTNSGRSRISELQGH